jgi:plasmid stability protein
VIPDTLLVVANIVIRGLDDGLKQQLRLRAASHGRSMEAEARELLKAGLHSRKVSSKEFLASIRALVESFGGVELEPYVRGKKPPHEFFAPGGKRGK